MPRAPQNAVRRPRAACLLIVLALAVLGGCGQKGDLYLPEERPAPEQPSPDRQSGDGAESAD